LYEVRIHEILRVCEISDSTAALFSTVKIRRFLQNSKAL